MELHNYRQQISLLKTVEERLLFFADLFLSQREDNTVSNFRRNANTTPFEPIELFAGLYDSHYIENTLRGKAAAKDVSLLNESLNRNNVTINEIIQFCENISKVNE